MLDQVRARERFTAIREEIQASLWFIPALCTGGAVLAASLALGLDQQIIGTDAAISIRALVGSPDSARDVMSVIAGGMVSIVGVTFSVVVIALVLASNQFSPRILRSFTSDRINQTVLGVFVGTFLYAVLILRSIRSSGDQGGAYVPALGVTLGMVGAVVALGFFIYFIHHISTTIQVSSIISSIASDTQDAIDELLDRPVGPTGPARIGARVRLQPDGQPVPAPKPGYLVRIDEDRLVRVAAQEDVVIESMVGPGDFRASGDVLAVVQGETSDTGALVDKVREAFVMRRHRTIPEDPAFGFRELSDIALKAISPAVNDPTTACTCVDYLGSHLYSMVDRDMPASEITDDEDRVRLRLPSAEFDDYVDLAFTEIRHYGGSDLAVVLRLLHALSRLAEATRREDRLEVVWQHARNVLDEADRGLQHDADRETVNRQFEALAGMLGQDPSSGLLELDRP